MSKVGHTFLLAYLFLIFWRPQEYIEAFKGLPIIPVIQVLVLISWIFSEKKWSAPQYKYLMLLTLTIFLSSGFALGLDISIDLTLQFIIAQAFVFLFIASDLTSSQRQVQLLKVFVFGTSLMALHSLDQALSVDKTGWTGQEMLSRTDSSVYPIYQTRYIGIFSDPNDLGMALVCSLPFIFLFIKLAQSNLQKIAWFCFIILHLYAIWLTNSRGTMLATGVMALGWLILRYGGIKFVLPVALAALIVPFILPSRLTVTGDQSSQDRIDAWYQGMQMFLSNPIFGVGKNAFMDYHHKTAHNSWVLAFAELGFVGFFAWIGLLFTSLYMVWVFQRQFSDTQLPGSLGESYHKERLLASATMFAMVGAFACAFFLSRTYIVLLYILPALAAAQYHRYQRDFSSVQVKPMMGFMFLISLGFIALIYIVVRIKT